MRFYRVYFLICLTFITSSCAIQDYIMSGAKVTEQFFDTDDGERIAVRYWENVKQPVDTVIVISPGLFQNKDTTVFRKIAKDLVSQYDVMVIDYRGHGRSSGQVYFGQKEHLDLHVVYQFAKSKYAHIGAVGFSLGGVITVKEESLNNMADSVVLISTPYDLAKAERGFLNPKEFISAVGIAVQNQELKTPIRLGPVNLSEKPVERIGSITNTPILFIHGQSDAIVSLKHSWELYHHTVATKDILIIENGLHAEKLYLADPYLFTSLLIEWFNFTLNPVQSVAANSEATIPVT